MRLIKISFACAIGAMMLPGAVADEDNSAAMKDLLSDGYKIVAATQNAANNDMSYILQKHENAFRCFHVDTGQSFLCERIGHR